MPAGIRPGNIIPSDLKGSTMEPYSIGPDVPYHMRIVSQIAILTDKVNSLSGLIAEVMGEVGVKSIDEEKRPQGESLADVLKRTPDNLALLSDRINSAVIELRSLLFQGG